MKDLVQQSSGGMVEVASSREIQEVQAAVIMAKRFPRNLEAVREEILEACSSLFVAESSQYSYNKGGTEVSGPSIRLAEVLKAAYENIDAGWREIERKPGIGNVPGESVIEAFAWDMQKNVRAKRTFTVRHWRDTKKGGYPLRDERDIYELLANQSARRLRACILELIPKFLQEEAITKCDETLKKNLGDIKERTVKLLAAFERFGVTKEVIEKRLTHKLESITESEIINLGKVYNSIKDGYGGVADFFEVEATEPTTKENVEVSTKHVAEIRSIKNFAPQTSEEAKRWKPGASQPSDSKSAKEEAQGPTREELIFEIMAVAKQLGLKAKDLEVKSKELTNKSSKELNESELADFLIVLQTELANKQA